MAKRTTEEKRLRRKQKRQQNVKDESIVFDVFSLLQEEKLETKPDVGEFLKKYVKSIRILVNHSKITVYPVHFLEISKVFVDFLDGHQIVCDFLTNPRGYFMYFGVDEVQMTDKQTKGVINLVQKLQEFGFVCP